MSSALYYPIAFLLCHLIPDYILQTDWMALNKSKKTFNCLVHVFIYTAFFLFLTTSLKALLFIGATHFIFDRWHIILRRLIWLKNHFPTGYPPFEYCDSTGYYDDSVFNTKKPNEEIINKWGKPRLFFITMWLYIITDNSFHLLCNLIALTLLCR